MYSIWGFGGLFGGLGAFPCMFLRKLTRSQDLVNFGGLAAVGVQIMWYFGVFSGGPEFRSRKYFFGTFRGNSGPAILSKVF